MLVRDCILLQIVTLTGTCTCTCSNSEAKLNTCIYYICTWSVSTIAMISLRLEIQICTQPCNARSRRGCDALSSCTIKISILRKWICRHTGDFPNVSIVVVFQHARILTHMQPESDEINMATWRSSSEIARTKRRVTRNASLTRVKSLTSHAWRHERASDKLTNIAREGGAMTLMRKDYSANMTRI